MERGLESSFAGADGSADLRAAQQAGDRLFTIGDMARAYRVTLRALRFYEDRGLIRPIRHGVSRFYDAAGAWLAHVGLGMSRAQEFQADRIAGQIAGRKEPRTR